MINITYIEDALIATKVTGDDNVPCGEVTFTCDLSPRLIFQSVSSYLEPLELNKKASRHWGKKYLPRYSGKGQVASKGFQNAQYVDGQLIMVGQCFTFAWMLGCLLVIKSSSKDHHQISLSICSGNKKIN